MRTLDYQTPEPPEPSGRGLRIASGVCLVASAAAFIVTKVSYGGVGGNAVNSMAIGALWTMTLAIAGVCVGAAALRREESSMAFALMMANVFAFLAGMLLCL